MAGENLDLTSEPAMRPAQDAQQPASNPAAGRRFVGIHFACCDVYSRIYVNREETAYSGHCPRCSRRISLRIGPGGSESRFFTAY